MFLGFIYPKLQLDLFFEFFVSKNALLKLTKGI